MALWFMAFYLPFKEKQYLQLWNFCRLDGNFLPWQVILRLTRGVAASCPAPGAERIPGNFIR